MALAGKPTTPVLLCITGASGAGKTATVAALRERIERRVLPTLELDALGVPSTEEMHAAWDSPRGWQKAMTYHWVYTAKHVYRTSPLVILEGQFDPQYAIAACSAHRVRSAVVLLHTNDTVRRERLTRRGQPELATAEMSTWAGYLHEQAQLLGGVVVDACASLDTVVDAVCTHAIPLLDAAADEQHEPRGPRERARRKTN